MIPRRQVINREQVAAALIEPWLTVTDDADGLSITLSSPAAVLRLRISPEGLPSMFVTWYEGNELFSYEADLTPPRPATGTVSSSVASWHLTRVSYAPQNGTDPDAD